MFAGWPSATTMSTKPPADLLTVSGADRREGRLARCAGALAFVFAANASDPFHSSASICVQTLSRRSRPGTRSGRRWVLLAAGPCAVPAQPRPKRSTCPPALHPFLMTLPLVVCSARLANPRTGVRTGSVPSRAASADAAGGAVSAAGGAGLAAAGAAAASAVPAPQQTLMPRPQRPLRRTFRSAPPPKQASQRLQRRRLPHPPPTPRPRGMWVPPRPQPPQPPPVAGPWQTL
jgi:hypothetical protein